MFLSPSRRLRRWLFLTLLLASAGGAAVWWYYSIQPDSRMRRGRAAIARSDWSAVDSLADKLEASGETDRANLLRGEALAGRGRWKEALAVLNKIIDEGELRRRSAVTVGRCLVEIGELREAFRVFSFVLSQDKDDIDAHRGMAAIAFDLGNLTAAIQHCDEVARLDDTDGRSYRMKALCYTYLSQDADAEHAYREALARKLGEDFRRQVRLELAERVVTQTRYAEALAILDERKGDGEDDLPALALRGKALVNLGRVPEAQRLLERGVEDYQRGSALWALLGQIHLARDEAAKAIPALEKAVALTPGDYEYRFQLAKAYAKVGRKQDESAQMRKSEELRQVLDQLSSLSREAMRKPWDAEIRLKLAALCEQAHDSRLAGMWYKAAEACRRAPE